MSVQFEWNGDQAKALTKAALGEGLAAAADGLKAASNEAAPSESGHLVRSSGTDVDRDALEASVYYGPTSAPRDGKPVYAIVRHEALRQGGAPKYLERPLVRFRAELAEIVARAVGRVL